MIKSRGVLHILLWTLLLLLPASSGFAWFGSAKKGDSAMPEFSLTTVNGGQTVSNKSLRGQVVLVNFWATWCGPCVNEFPDLNRLHGDLGAKGFLVLALSMDERVSDVEAFVAKQRPTFLVAMGSKKLIRKFGGGGGLPVSFLISRQGKIIKKYYGPRPYELFRSDIEEQLRQPLPPG
ncbi:MAG: TlpA disulfide reductase family protein [Thermodesulfobacteriota bacterium]